MAKYKGLIVDDSKGVRTTVAAMLQILGHDSDAAASVEEARELMAEKLYDYMLLDMEIRWWRSGYRHRPRVSHGNSA